MIFLVLCTLLVRFLIYENICLDIEDLVMIHIHSKRLILSRVC